MSRVVNLEKLTDDELKTRSRVLRYDMEHAADTTVRDKSRSDLKAIETIVAKRAAAKKPAGGLRGWVAQRLGAAQQ
jgi:hypothetical protein